MKKTLLVCCVSALAIMHNVNAQDRRAERKLKAAIATNAALEVEKLLKKGGIITAENKKEFLDDALDQVEYYEDTATVWNVPKDAVCAVAGLGLGALSTTLLAIGAFRAIDERSNSSSANSHGQRVMLKKSSAPYGYIPFLSTGGLLLPVALYLGKRGFSGVARATALEGAEDIVHLLEKALGQGITT